MLSSIDLSARSLMLDIRVLKVEKILTGVLLRLLLSHHSFKTVLVLEFPARMSKEELSRTDMLMFSTRTVMVITFQSTISCLKDKEETSSLQTLIFQNSQCLVMN